MIGSSNASIFNGVIIGTSSSEIGNQCTSGNLLRTINVKAGQAQGFRINLFQVDSDGFSIIRAHLNFHGTVFFQLYDYAWISRLFVPVDEIMEEVENRCRNFSDAMIGVHIRRTDNLASIRQSPIELFYQKLDEKIKEDGKVAIYLATDSEEVKREMKERYGDRIFCSGKKADRGSLEGIREGITDMYTLARTQKIYGSFQSSFSDMAAQIGGVPLEILKL